MMCLIASICLSHEQKIFDSESGKCLCLFASKTVQGGLSSAEIYIYNTGVVKHNPHWQHKYWFLSSAIAWIVMGMSNQFKCCLFFFQPVPGWV